MTEYESPDSPGGPSLVTTRRRVRALDVGVIGIFQVDRFSIAPWLGARAASSNLDTTTHDFARGVDSTTTMTYDRPVVFSAGVTIGADLYVSGPHRFTLFMTAQLTSAADYDGDIDDAPDYRYRAITVGGAYRL